jgi:hypothetical protein
MTTVFISMVPLGEWRVPPPTAAARRSHGSACRAPADEPDGEAHAVAVFGGRLHLPLEAIRHSREVLARATIIRSDARFRLRLWNHNRDPGEIRDGKR